MGAMLSPNLSGVECLLLDLEDPLTQKRQEVSKLAYG